MMADEFNRRFIGLDDEVPNFGSDPSIPVMVRSVENGQLFSIEDLSVEHHEPGGYTVWIKVVEF